MKTYEESNGMLIADATGNLKTALHELKKDGYQPIPLADDLRALQGNTSHFVKEAALYVPENIFHEKTGIYLIRNSPIVANLTNSVATHKAGNDILVPSIDDLLEGAVHIAPEMITPDNKYGHFVHISNENPETQELAKWVYGEHIRDTYNVTLRVLPTGANLTIPKKPFVRQLVVSALSPQLEILATNRQTHQNLRPTRGIKYLPQ